MDTVQSVLNTVHYTARQINHNLSLLISTADRWSVGEGATKLCGRCKEHEESGIWNFHATYVLEFS